MEKEAYHVIKFFNEIATLNKKKKKKRRNVLRVVEQIFARF